tara:strand:- start:2753 stop:2935 length:183 start_codon:yes stop_codon:yes gene_type:complete
MATIINLQKNLDKNLTLGMVKQLKEAINDLRKRVKKLEEDDNKDFTDAVGKLIKEVKEDK